MSVSQTIDSLMQVTVPYSVSSGVNYGKDSAGNTVFQIPDGGAQYHGDMSGDIWKETNKMGKDQFLFLLCTQLKYQDPLNPMENTEFVSQLAQFRALETGENTESAIRELGKAFNDNLTAQMYASNSVANSSAMSLIGREVRMRQVTVKWDGKAGDQIPINVHLGNNDNGVLTIRDKDDNVIKTFNINKKDAQNSAVLYWDGKDDRGQPAKIGAYVLKMEGQDSDSSLYPFVQAVVEGVRFTPDGVLVKIGGKEISIGEVLDVSVNEEGYLTQSNALALMGKLVRSRQNSIMSSGNAHALYDFTINAPAGQKVEVEIINSSGKVVSKFSGTADENGKLKGYWNGTDYNGELMPAGEYRINVVGSDKNAGLYAYNEGIVEGLTSLTGNFKLRVGGREVALEDILDISAPKS